MIIINVIKVGFKIDPELQLSLVQQLVPVVPTFDAIHDAAQDFV